MKVEALFAGQNCSLGGGFDQPENPRRDARRERMNARADFDAFDVGSLSQRQNGAKALQQPREGAIVLPALEMKGLETLGELRVGQQRLAREIGSGANQRRPRSLARNRNALRKTRC